MRRLVEERDSRQERKGRRPTPAVESTGAGSLA